MTSQWVRGPILAAGAAGLLALSVGTASASANTQRALPNSSIVTIVWQGPDTSEAVCQAVTAYEKTQPNVIAASCDYREYAPYTGEYEPGWYNYEAIQNPNY